MKLPDYEWVFFDLDGTLIDHFSAIHEAYRFAQERLGLLPASYEKVRRTVGGSVPVTMRRLAGSDLPEAGIGEALRLFDERFEQIMFDQVEILPGIPEVLEDLGEAGVPMAVFTNKKGEHARSVLAHLGLDTFFQTIVGAGDTPHRKPDPEFTDHILGLTQANPKRSALVGDSPFDVEAGKVRDMTVAAVATGSHSVEQLRETAADAVFPDAVALRGVWMKGNG